MKSIIAVSIFGLNGKTDVRLPLNGGHCIIVGPNGSGKSTALQIISFALGRRWLQLASLRFESISVEFLEGKAVLSRSACASAAQGFGSGPTRLGRVIQRLIDADQLEAFQRVDLDIRTSALRFRTITEAPLSELKNIQNQFKMNNIDEDSQKEITTFRKILDKNEIPASLYLPTSRRIEFDISRFTERLPDFAKNEVMTSLKGVKTEFFEEVLRFGMDDIQVLITDFEQKIRDYSRDRFNKMMSSFLKEMANSQSISISDLRALKIDQKRIDNVLSRIEEGLLSAGEKAQIGDIIMSMVRPQRGGQPPFHKRWLAHFFVRLLEVNSDIDNLERPIRDLVTDLAKYLSPKSVTYDIEKYSFSIADGDGEKLMLGDLSSGEKQLVSLLTILQISAQQKVNVFIDEPELSLSVPWQSEFLPDIVEARSCNQLFAVTHSPFVYENDLGISVVDFLECARA